MAYDPSHEPANLTPEIFRDEFARMSDMFNALAHSVPAHVYKRKDTNIGPSMRHLVEYTQALASALEEGHSGVYYDRRQRKKSLEKSPQKACAAMKKAIDTIITHIEQPNIGLGEPMTGYTIINKDLPEFPSLPGTLTTQLTHVLGHFVHHSAYMRELIDKAGYMPPCGAGLAAATLKHRKK